MESFFLRILVADSGASVDECVTADAVRVAADRSLLLVVGAGVVHPEISIAFCAQVTFKFEFS